MNEEQKKLFEVAQQLEQWARESRAGGWSTHQVEPMRQKADEIYAFLGRKLGNFSFLKG